MAEEREEAEGTDNMTIGRPTILAATLLVTLSGVLFSQKQFDSPQAAAESLIDATAKGDSAALDAIFGQQGKNILTSGDPKQDQAERAEFARVAHDRHEVNTDSRSASRAILLIGADDWPFPVPMVRKNGKWSFDAAEGDVEMRARLVGANELDAIEICAGYVEAQKEFAEQNREKANIPAYARRLSSSPGRHDGLYWDGGSLVPKSFAEAAWESKSGSPPKAKPYHGYYFRILESQGPNAAGGQHHYLVKDLLMGGFGLVAWPADYGVTGIHTFIVNQEGAVYQKDLAPKLRTAGPPVTEYDPDSSWTPVE